MEFADGELYLTRIIDKDNVLEEWTWACKNIEFEGRIPYSKRTSSEYIEKDENGEIAYLEKYDKQGNVIENQWLLEDGTTCVNKRDEQGNIVEIQCLENQEILWQEFRKYDEKGELVFVENNMYSEELLKSGYAKTSTYFRDGRIVKTVAAEAGWPTQTDLYDENGNVAEVNFETGEKAVFKYEQQITVRDSNVVHNWQVVGVRFENQSETKDIQFTTPFVATPGDIRENTLGEAECLVYARLAREDLSTITRDNINKKLAESYIKSGNVPSEGNVCYKIYNNLLNAQQGATLSKQNVREP
ncbi:MAG: hypothetical protein J5895_04340 [Alphaproteobacteria bacterium]|nr:hypothetical protein [Alphaproteobacteria bacterium]